jgi:hypothetical protein
MNPYIGLQDYLSWENCGVERGNKITDKEYQKLKPAEQQICKPFEVNGEKLWFLPKERALNYIIRHSGDVVPWREVFTSRVFTSEVIDELDQNVIKPMFKYSSLAEIEKDELSDFEHVGSDED